MAKGKYQEWLTPDGLVQLEGWARDGLTDENIAKKIGISPSTFYAWLLKYPEISEAIKKGKAPVDIEVENALLKRALGYEYEETTKEIRVMPGGKQYTTIRTVTKRVVPDVTAQIIWLNNRKPESWRRDRQAPPASESANDDGFIEALSGTAAEDWADEE